MSHRITITVAGNIEAGGSFNFSPGEDLNSIINKLEGVTIENVDLQLNGQTATGDEKVQDGDEAVVVGRVKAGQTD